MYTLPNPSNTPTSEIILNHLPACFETFVLFLLVLELNIFSCSSSLNKLKPGCVFPYFVGGKTNHEGYKLLDVQMRSLCWREFIPPFPWSELKDSEYVS